MASRRRAHEKSKQQNFPLCENVHFFHFQPLVIIVLVTFPSKFFTRHAHIVRSHSQRHLSNISCLLHNRFNVSACSRAHFFLAFTPHHVMAFNISWSFTFEIPNADEKSPSEREHDFNLQLFFHRPDNDDRHCKFAIQVYPVRCARKRGRKTSF